MGMNPNTEILVDSFNALADAVQSLIDRQTILEHKLVYAHEQFQYLADKYAPAAPEISDTLLKLQLPPELHHPALAITNSVPLPKRQPSGDSKHQIALIIKEGRRVASSLKSDLSSSRSSREGETTSASHTNTMTSVSTALEQDFTVEGKRGTLGCPFSQPIIVEEVEAQSSSSEAAAQIPDQTPHHSADPICAAMYEETTSQRAPSTAGGATKCPIRYMNQHSPEEIAHYLETHKHELPRSHEVCLRRYQKNEDHIRKLDAKYGNLVNMVEGLSKIHQPMLPEQDTRPQSDVEKVSNERVETWAQTVSATVTEDPDRTATDRPHPEDEDERQSHFDRPLKEVRVGESPSRPWGISVPIFDSPSNPGDGMLRPESPPPAPVHMPSPTPETPAAQSTGKCPFDHTKLQLNGSTPVMAKHEGKSSVRIEDFPSNHPFTPSPAPNYSSGPHHHHPATTPGQPAFINNPSQFQNMANHGPQMVFTGPVFIGYPMEQAIQYMQHFQGRQ